MKRVWSNITSDEGHVILNFIQYVAKCKHLFISTWWLVGHNLEVIGKYFALLEDTLNEWLVPTPWPDIQLWWNWNATCTQTAKGHLTCASKAPICSHFWHSPDGHFGSDTASALNDGGWNAWDTFSSPWTMVLSSLKSHWRRECQHFYTQNPSKVISRRNFMGVFQKAWVQGMSISNVIGSFRTTGVYPVDRRVLSQLSQETSISPRCSSPTPKCPFACRKKKVLLMPSHHALSHLSPLSLQLMRWKWFQAHFLESIDSRYALWLETFYPQSSAKVRPGASETILKRPPPPAQQRAHKYPLDWLVSYKRTIHQGAKSDLLFHMGQTLYGLDFCQCEDTGKCN